MGYEHVYQGHAQPPPPAHSQFGEAWPPQHNSSTHPPPAPMYPTAMAAASNPVNIKREDVARPPPGPPPPPAAAAAPPPHPPALSVPYSNGPVSAPSSVVPNGLAYSTPGPGYSQPELMVLPPDHPRTTFDQAQNSSMHAFAAQPPGYGPLDYGQSVAHHPHQHQQHPQPPPPHPHPHQQPQPQSQPQPHQPQHHQSPGHPADGRSLPPGLVSPSPAKSPCQQWLKNYMYKTDSGQNRHEPPTTAPTSQQQPPPPPPAPTYGDTLDASRGMVALSQDLAPRNMYAPQPPRGSREPYAFPAPHSSGSSISSANNYPYYSASVVSVDSSVTDYSSTSDSYDGLQGRTLPRLSGLVAGSIPPGPQSMMSQFSSKIPSSAQKKHKCKVCDKRFTRPSSLQTHMYSHTGEKRTSLVLFNSFVMRMNILTRVLLSEIAYACDYEGCGRHFSVVSNLRRHKKVHKSEKDSGSPDEEE